jgi:hypothetical protein
MKILGRKLQFGDPPAADIVIFDETNSHFVREALDRNYKIVVFKMRPEEIWLGFKVALYFLRFLGQLRLGDAFRHQSGPVRGMLAQFRFIYFEACLVTMKPKAVVTFIDNSPIFGRLSKNCREFPFFAIQNGSRLSYAAHDNTEYYLQHLFCFGEHETHLFPKLGYQVENFYPVGSLVASVHFDRDPAIQPEKYDLLVVSSWRGNIGFSQEVKDTMHSMRIMDEFLSQYIKSKGIKAGVILRAERNSEHWFMAEIGRSEENYYREIYGNYIDVIETDFVKRNIFPLMQQSQVIVSCLSSALLEAFGIGKKILYCNFTGTDQYHRDFDSSIVISDSNYAAFSQRLDELFQMPHLEYSKRYKECQKYFMNNPKDKPTYQAIAEKVTAIIENKKLT